MDEKRWFKSKTVWASLIILAIAGLNALGMRGAGEEIAAESETMQEWIMQLVTIVAGLLALIGRIMAKNALTK